MATDLPVGVLFNQRLNYTRTESGGSAQQGIDKRIETLEQELQDLKRQKNDSDKKK
jgi:hypothetical protein